MTRTTADELREITDRLYEVYREAEEKYDDWNAIRDAVDAVEYNAPSDVRGELEYETADGSTLTVVIGDGLQNKKPDPLLDANGHLHRGVRVYVGDGNRRYVDSIDGVDSVGPAPYRLSSGEWIHSGQILGIVSDRPEGLR